MNQTKKKLTKNLILGPTLTLWAKFRPPIFFPKSLAPSVTRYHGQLSSCTIPEKTNDPILRKGSDGWTEEQTEQQRGQSDFIGHC